MMQPTELLKDFGMTGFVGDETLIRILDVVVLGRGSVERRMTRLIRLTSLCCS